MAVISISIEQSEIQIMSGIPKTISISANIPSSIFYTLDGSDPTINSTIYTSIIYMPTEKPRVVLKAFASNGVDVSPIISQEFGSSILNKNARIPFSNTDQAVDAVNSALYPFGTNGVDLTSAFNQVNTHLTVDNPNLPRLSNAFDSDGYETNFSNHPLTTENYSVINPERDKSGGYKIGYLKNKSEIFLEPEDPEETQQFTRTFNPRAMVVFQNYENEDPNDPPQINKQQFILDKQERTRDGNAFFVSGVDAPPVNGTFLRAHYNPRTNDMNYYYLDTHSQKWIISTQQFHQTGPYDGNLAGQFFSRGKGAGKVFKWNMFGRRHLF